MSQELLTYSWGGSYKSCCVEQWNEHFLNREKVPVFALGAAGVSAAVHREHQAQGGVGQPQDHGKPQEIPGTSTGSILLRGQPQDHGQPQEIP